MAKRRRKLSAFGSKFAAARAEWKKRGKSGDDTFTFNGKKYTIYVKGERKGKGAKAAKADTTRRPDNAYDKRPPVPTPRPDGRTPDKVYVKGSTAPSASGGRKPDVVHVKTDVSPDAVPANRQHSPKPDNVGAPSTLKKGQELFRGKSGNTVVSTPGPEPKNPQYPKSDEPAPVSTAEDRPPVPKKRAATEITVSKPRYEQGPPASAKQAKAETPAPPPGPRAAADQPEREARRAEVVAGRKQPGVYRSPEERTGFQSTVKAVEDFGERAKKASVAAGERRAAELALKFPKQKHRIPKATPQAPSESKVVHAVGDEGAVRVASYSAPATRVQPSAPDRVQPSSTAAVVKPLTMQQERIAGRDVTPTSVPRQAMNAERRDRGRTTSSVRYSSPKVREDLQEEDRATREDLEFDRRRRARL